MALRAKVDVWEFWMLHYYRFHQDLPAPEPAKETYNRRSAGKGWPEECPPVRAANSFGWDVTAAFDMTFRRKSKDRQEDGGWELVEGHDVESDWLYKADPESQDEAGVPLVQRNAWFWDAKQELPHRISPNVYERIQRQVKVSTYLFLQTDPNELIYMCDVPNREKPWHAVSCVLETDWYPASYPWHCVLEFDEDADEIHIAKDEPICRLFLVRRDNYFAREMEPAQFDQFFERGQAWLSTHGRGDRPEMLDITRTYVKQQRKATFTNIL